MLYCIIWYYIILYYILFYYIILYYIILYNAHYKSMYFSLFIVDNLSKSMIKTNLLFEQLF